MEKVTGGIIVPDGTCNHKKKSYTGETKKEDGVLWYAFRCESCGAIIWIDESEIIAPGIKV